MKTHNETERNRPLLRRDLKIHQGEEGCADGKSWIIFDPVSDKYFRIGGEEYAIAARLDGKTDIDSLCEILSRTDTPAEKKSILETVSFLERNGLLKVPEASKSMKKKSAPGFSGAVLKILYLYLSFKIPLWNPDDFISRTTPAVSLFTRKWIVFFLSAMSLSGYFCVAAAWERCSDDFLDSLQLKGAIMYVLAITVVKIIHELAHAYSAKFAGIRVRMLGLGFIFFLPRLYTDVTDAWQIRDRKKRMLIDGAGILIEIMLGGIAALIWANTGRGMVNSIAYYILAVSVVDTILINGNPFFKYDGYYLLMDFTGIDNLQVRASAKIRSVFHRIFLGIKSDLPSSRETWMEKILLPYGILSFVYKFLIYTSIVAVIYFKFTKTVGIIFAAAEVYMLFLQPVAVELKIIAGSRKEIKNLNFYYSSAVLLCMLLLLFTPLPWSIGMPCEFKSVKSAVIYAENSGFIDKIAAADGCRVTSGTPLFILSNPFIAWDEKTKSVEREIIAAEIDQIESDSQSMSLVKIKSEQLGYVETELAELERKKKLLKIASPFEGVFSLRSHHLQPGKWLNTGDFLGEVFNPVCKTVLAYAGEKDAGKIKPGDRVSLVLNGEIRKIKGAVKSVVSAPKKIHSPFPLLDVCGGTLETKNVPNPEFLKPYYEVIIEPSDEDGLPCGRTGQAFVRKYSSVGGSFVRSVLSAVMRESSF